MFADVCWWYLLMFPADVCWWYLVMFAEGICWCLRMLYADVEGKLSYPQREGAFSALENIILFCKKNKLLSTCKFIYIYIYIYVCVCVCVCVCRGRENSHRFARSTAIFQPVFRFHAFTSSIKLPLHLTCHKPRKWVMDWNKRGSVVRSICWLCYHYDSWKLLEFIPERRTYANIDHPCIDVTLLEEYIYIYIYKFSENAYFTRNLTTFRSVRLSSGQCIIKKEKFKLEKNKTKILFSVSLFR